MDSGLNIFFDVDYTIIGMDNSLRPGTEKILKKLTDDNHRVFIWSGAGKRTAILKHYNLEGYVSNVYQKPLEDFEKGLITFGITVKPDFVVDDHPDIVMAFGGVVVQPYYFLGSKDEDMATVYSIVTNYALKGRCAEVTGTGLSLPRHFHAPWCDITKIAERLGYQP